MAGTAAGILTCVYADVYALMRLWLWLCVCVRACVAA